MSHQFMRTHPVTEAFRGNSIMYLKKGCQKRLIEGCLGLNTHYASKNTVDLGYIGLGYIG